MEWRDELGTMDETGEMRNTYEINSVKTKLDN